MELKREIDTSMIWIWSVHNAWAPQQFSLRINVTSRQKINNDTEAWNNNQLNVINIIEHSH